MMIRRLGGGATSLEPAPLVRRMPRRIRVVNYSLTHRCNLACKCCYKKQEAVEATAESALEMIEALGLLKVETLMLGGGEPLLRADLPAILHRAARLGMRTFLASNGSLFDEGWARVFRQADLGLFFLGMDDPLEAGGRDGSLELSRRALGLLQRARIPFAVNLIITSALSARFEETLLVLRGMGVHHVNLLRPRPDAGDVWFPSVRLRPADLLRLRDLRLVLCERLGMHLSLDCSLGLLIHGTREPEYFKDVVACSAGLHYFHMDPGGDVYPCPYLARPEMKVANLLDPLFLERWEAHALLGHLRSRDFKAGCGNCDYRGPCGGCRALALRDHQDVLAADPDCPFSGTTAPD